MTEMTHNEEQVCFYFELGLAITQWAHVEVALWWLADFCLATKELGASGRGFYSIENFRSKLAFVDATVQVSSVVSTAHRERWNALRVEIESAQSKRNKLAHYSVLNLLSGKPGRRIAFYPIIPRGADLKKPKKPRAGKILPPLGSWFLKDIYQARLQFVQVSMKVENLLAEMKGEKPRFEADALRARKAPEAAQLARQMRAMLPPREKPSRG